MGAAQKLPEKGCVFISVNNSDKPTVLPLRATWRVSGSRSPRLASAAFLRAHGSGRDRCR